MRKNGLIKLILLFFVIVIFPCNVFSAPGQVSISDITNWDITNGIAGMDNGILYVGASAHGYADTIRSKKSYAQPLKFTWKGWYPMSYLSANHTGIGQAPFFLGGGPSSNIYMFMTMWNYADALYISYPECADNPPPLVQGLNINNHYTYGEFSITWQDNIVKWFVNGNEVGQRSFESSEPVYLYFAAYDQPFKVESVSVNETYRFGGFSQPLNLNKPFKLGSSVPIKFQLLDSRGNLVTDAIASLMLQQYSNESPVGVPIEATATRGVDEGNIFRFVDYQYIFNLDTKVLSTGLWQLQVKLDDGTTQTTYFSLK